MEQKRSGSEGVKVGANGGGVCAETSESLRLKKSMRAPQRDRGFCGALGRGRGMGLRVRGGRCSIDCVCCAVMTFLDATIVTISSEWV